MSIIDQIDLSLDKANSLQQKRIEAEESKQKSLNFEIDQLRNQLDGSQVDDYENQYTPEKSHSLSQYSPLRNDIKNLELQNQLLASSEKKLKKELDVSDNEIDSEILPKYEYQQKGKAPSRKLSEPKQKPKLAASQQQCVKQKTQQKTIPKTTQIITKVEKKPEKENYVIQEQRQDYVQLQKHIKNVKETVSNQLTKKEVLKKETQQENESSYKIRGYRDQAEIKYFGRPLPCNECVFLLNKGMSSDFCSQHGKICKEKPQSKQLPKRLAKYF